MGPDRRDGRGPVFRQQRIGNAMGETAIRFVVDLHETEGQVWLQQVDDPSRATVARIGDDGQGRQRGRIDIPEQVFDVRLDHVDPAYRTAACRRGEGTVRRAVPDFGQP